MLVNVLDIPADDDDLAWWGFANDQQHQAFISAINTKYGLRLQSGLIYPVNKSDLKTWLQVHQQLHDDLNAVLGYPGADLEDVNLDNPEERAIWLQLHFLEHQNASAKLAVP